MVFISWTVSGLRISLKKGLQTSIRGTSLTFSSSRRPKWNGDSRTSLGESLLKLDI